MERKKINVKDFAGLNVKARFQNKVFVSGFISLIALIISKIALQFFGVDISETVTATLEIVEYVLYALVMLGVLVDPSVEGFGDSDYTKAKDKPTNKHEKVEVKGDNNGVEE